MPLQQIESALMHGAKPNNTGAIICYHNSRAFILKQQTASFPIAEPNYLLIDRQTHQMKIIQNFTEEDYQSCSYSAVIGVVQICKSKHLLLCQESRLAGVVGEAPIFQVASLTFLSYEDPKDIAKKKQSTEIYRTIRNFSSLLKNGFYFSHLYELTRSLGDQQEGIEGIFAWNFLHLREFEKYGVGSTWYCPLVQGFVRQFEAFLEGSRVTYTLISRRSRHKGGTRYFDRGINDQGEVANFCETEQILRIQSFYISDIQIRGNVPIFFEQVGLTTKTHKNRGDELTHKIFRKHMHRLFRNYGRVFIVNLLTMGKRGERMLIEAFEKHIREENEARAKYFYCDFHHVASGGCFQNIDGEIQKVRQMKNNLRFYLYDSKKDEVLCQPEGIFRTNCLDCLDRTNYFQAKLALITVETILKQLGLGNRDLLAQMKSDAVGQFITLFRHAWADNGDAISFHYTGTGSTHTDITRDGKRGWLGQFKHKYKSVTRFYNQHFWDFKKMKILQAFLGNVQPQAPVQDLISSRRTEFLQQKTASVWIFSWKTPSTPAKALDLFPNDVDIIVVSLQDMTQPQHWKTLISQSVDKQKYVLVDSYFAYGNCLSVYVRNQIKNNISHVQHSSVKFTSYYSVLTNKSACLIRFNLADSSLLFAGCQLEKGEMVSRVHNLRELHDEAFQLEAVGVQKTQPITEDDTVFLIGNMNTTLPQHLKKECATLPRGDLSETQQQVVDRIMEQDQFHSITSNLIEYRKYEEARITFPPTYKWNGRNLDPDHSCWPDRIWYSSDDTVRCLKYTTLQQMRERHVPVIAHFEVEVNSVDALKRNKICEEIVESQGPLNTIDESFLEFDQQIRI